MAVHNFLTVPPDPRLFPPTTFWLLVGRQLLDDLCEPLDPRNESDPAIDEGYQRLGCLARGLERLLALGPLHGAVGLRERESLRPAVVPAIVAWPPKQLLESLRPFGDLRNHGVVALEGGLQRSTELPARDDALVEIDLQ